MNWARFAEALFLPPGSLFWLVFTGLLLLLARRLRPGLTLLALGLGPLYLLATPWVAALVLTSLDRYPELAVEEPVPADVVVVLGAGGSEADRRRAPGGLSPMSVERLAYGGELSRRLGVPLLISGEMICEGGVLMLADRYGISPRWLECRSRTTLENARFSAGLLRADRMNRVYLVSHFYHLPRAVAAFESVGLEVVPAPMGFTPAGSTGGGVAGVVPRASSWLASAAAMHEIFGRLWYRLRYGV